MRFDNAEDLHNVALLVIAPRARKFELYPNR
jgi:hypothetical protein